MFVGMGSRDYAWCRRAEARQSGRTVRYRLRRVRACRKVRPETLSTELPTPLMANSVTGTGSR